MDPETVKIREVVVSYRYPRTAPAIIRGPEDAVGFLRRMIGRAAREHFVAVYLDGRNAPIAYSIVSIGTATAALVHPREVFQPAIACGAVRLIVAHNHPSGQVSPSREDHDVAARLTAAGKVLGIEVLDSLVVGRDGFSQIEVE